MSFADKQEAEIVRIKRCRNHYQVLDVPRTANNGGIKAASKRILLLVHPDKNNHPEATEVTKRVNKAVEVLTDASQRLNYNRSLDREKKERKWFFEVPKPQGNNKHYVLVLIVTSAIVAIVYWRITRNPYYNLHRSGGHQILKRTAEQGVEYRKLLFLVARKVLWYFKFKLRFRLRGL